MSESGPLLVLMGAPGSGKSTVGKLLASITGATLIDTDEAIEQNEGRSVAEIFVEDGEPFFRRLEAQAVASVIEQPQSIVSLGGGAVLDPHTRQALKDQPVVWLQISADVASRRVGMQAPRPLLVGNVRTRMITLMAEREPIYRELAKMQIATDDRDPGEVAQEIIDWLRNAERL